MRSWMNTPEKVECRHVSGQKTFLFLAGKGPHKQFAGVAEPYHKNLDHELLTGLDHIGFAPVYLGPCPGSNSRSR